MLTGRGALGRPLVVAAALAAALTGCSSSSQAGDAPDDPPSATGSSSPAAPSSAPAAQPAGLRTSFPKQELEFTELPTATGPVRGALESYVTFESLVRRSFRAASVPPRMRRYASQPVLSIFRSSANTMQRRAIHFEGPTGIAVTSARGNDDLVALNICIDASQTMQVVKGRTKPLDGPPSTKVRAVVTHTDGRWVVTEYSSKGEPC